MICPQCGIAKEDEDFPKRGSGKRRYSYCKPCHVKYQRVSKLRNIFNLTPEDAQAILDHQGGVCPICLRAPKAGGKGLSIDHDHKTGLIRGRVCWLCNQALGMLADDWERMVRMLQYLEKPPAVAALGEERFGRVGRVDNRAPSRRRRRLKNAEQAQ